MSAQRKAIDAILVAAGIPATMQVYLHEAINSIRFAELSEEIGQLAAAVDYGSAGQFQASPRTPQQFHADLECAARHIDAILAGGHDQGWNAAVASVLHLVARDMREGGAA